MARDLGARFQDKYGGALLITGVYGSTARGTDADWSDLELLFVVDGARDVDRHVLVRGVPVGWRLMGRASLEQLLEHPSAR